MRKVPDRAYIQADLAAQEKRKASGVPSSVRSDVTKALSAKPVSAEITPEDPRLADYKAQYEALPDDHKNGFTWEQVAARLSANPEKLQKALNMQGSGQLWYVESNGEVQTKDKGAEPVMYGWDEDDKLVQIYGRDSEQMGKVKKWANSAEIEARVVTDGYELFEADGKANDNYCFSDDMRRAAAVNDDQLFVADEDGQEWRDSLLKNACGARFDPNDGDIFVYDVDPDYRDDDRGVVRRLRI